MLRFLIMFTVIIFAVNVNCPRAKAQDGINPTKTAEHFLLEDDAANAAKFAALSYKARQDTYNSSLYAYCLFRIGKIDKARRVLPKVAEPTCFWTQLTKGRLLAWDGQFALARRILHDAATSLVFNPTPTWRGKNARVFAWTALEDVLCQECGPGAEPRIRTDEDRLDLQNAINDLRAHNPIACLQFGLSKWKPTFEFNDTDRPVTSEKLFLEGNYMKVLVYINDTPFKLLIDTGAVGITLTRQSGDRLDKSKLRFVDNSFIAGGGSPVSVGIWASNNIRIGRAEFTDSPVEILKDAAPGDKYLGDGIIGTFIFRRFKVELRPRDGIFRLVYQSGPARPLPGGQPSPPQPNTDKKYTVPLHMVMHCIFLILMPMEKIARRFSIQVVRNRVLPLISAAEL